MQFFNRFNYYSLIKKNYLHFLEFRKSYFTIILYYIAYKRGRNSLIAFLSNYILCKRCQLSLSEVLNFYPFFWMYRFDERNCVKGRILQCRRMIIIQRWGFMFNFQWCFHRQQPFRMSFVLGWDIFHSAYESRVNNRLTDSHWSESYEVVLSVAGRYSTR